MTTASHDAVVWQQGTLVTPQHMQQQDASLRAQSHLALKFAVPQHAGVLHLDVDSHALTEGRLHLEAGRVIMPEGELVCWDARQGDAPLVRALTDVTTNLPPPYDIMLILPPRSVTGANVSLESTPHDAHTQTRYLARAISLHDHDLAAAAPHALLVRRPNAQLKMRHELVGNEEALQILRLGRGADGSLALDESFCPMTLRLRACAGLMHALGALHTRVTGAEQATRPKTSTAMWVSSQEQARHHALYRLRMALKTVVAETTITPARADALLRERVADFVPGPTDDPFADHILDGPFDPAHPGDSLWPLIHWLMGATVAQSVHVQRYACRPREDGLLVATWAPKPNAQTAWYLHITFTGLGSLPQGMQQARRASAPWLRLAKVAAPSQMPRLLRAALRGLTLTQPQEVPPALRGEEAALTLSLPTHDAHWAAIEAEGLLALALPPGFSPQDVTCEVVAVGHEGAPL